MSECNIHDVCVVGAGIIGSSAAYHVVQNTKNVLLCDQFPMGHSRGSSHGHSRIIRKSYIQQHYARMMPEAYQIWQNLEAASNTELLKWVPISLNHWSSLCRESTTQNFKSLEKCLQETMADYTYLTHESLTKQFPMTRYPKDYNGILEPSGGLLKADKCCAAFQSLFQSAGGTIQECCKVTKIIPGKILTIMTANSAINAKSVIITAGPWTNDLLGSLNLRLPLKGIKTDVCYWKADDCVYSAENGFPCLIDSSMDLDLNVCALPNLEYPGMLKTCHLSGNDDHPDNRDLKEDRTNILKVGKYIRDHFDGVADQPSIIDRCFYTWTPDEDYIIDTHPVYKNIIIGAGFSGHGFKLAPVSGKLLSQLALKIRPDYDVSPFSASRFRKKSSL